MIGPGKTLKTFLDLDLEHLEICEKLTTVNYPMQP